MLKLFSVRSNEVITIGTTLDDIKIRMYSSNDQVSNAYFIGQTKSSLYFVTPCNISANVGVGTVSPLSNLHVQGNVLITSNLTTSNIYFTGQLLQNGSPFVSGSGGTSSNQWNTSNTVAQTGSNSVYIVGSNIGIGTAVPQSNLDLWGTFNVTINNQKQFGISSNQLYYGYDTATIPFIYANTLNVTSTSTLNTIITSNITTTTINTQNNSINAGSGTILASNVGIGITNPSGQLQIATSTVQAYPPAAMTGYLTNLTSSGYGVGYYLATASSEYSSNYAWKAFDKNVANIWYVAGTYNGATPGLYTGSVWTIDTSGNSYTGEWLQLQTPVSIILSNYSLQCASDVAYRQPYIWYILGSRNGINWTLIDQRSAITWTTSQIQTFTTNATQAYNYYRCVVNQINGGTALTIAEWTLNGTLQGTSVTNDGRLGVGVVAPTRALEVTGDIITGGTLSSLTGIMFRNRVYNGDFKVNQRGISSTTSGYFVDRFVLVSSTTSLTSTVQTLISSDTPYQFGFSNSIRCTATTGVSLPSGYVYPAEHHLEALNVIDLNWGTSYGSPVTVSFWFRTNMAASSTSSLSLRNGFASSAWSLYVASFTVAGGGAWQYVTITIPPPPSGTTWNMSSPSTWTSTGIEILVAATNSGGSALGWSTSGNPGYSGQTTWWTTTNNYVEFAGLQFEKGTQATPFEFRPFGTERKLCQRYFEIILDTAPTNSGWAYNSFANGTANNLWFNYKVTKRAVPTLYSASVTAAAGTITQTSIGTSYISWTIAASAGGTFGFTISSFPLGVTADL